MIAFVAMFLAVIAWLERTKLLSQLGAGRAVSADLDLTPVRCAVLLVPMAGYVLFVIGGIHTILDGVGAGKFRAELGNGGALGYLILKFYAPALFSVTALCMATTRRLSLFSVASLVLLAVISISFGYKSAIIMALLPTAVLLFWNCRLRSVLYLGGAVTVAIVVSYWFMKPDDQVKIPLLAAIGYRAFVLNAEGAWKIWDIYSSGGDLPSYLNTLPAVFGDRVYSALTGITRSDPEAWVMSHFSLMATHLSGYKPEYLLATGHNNSAGVMAEGIIAGGVAGMLAFAAVAAVITNALYHFIENRLEAQDFAAASVAACYFVYSLIAWMIGGGVVEIIHLSIIVGTLSSFALLRWTTGWRPSWRLQEAS